MKLQAPEALARLVTADHAILATIDPSGLPALVPVVFALHERLLAIPIDRVKEKGPGPLRRERNLESEPRATLLCEHWDAGDWSRLWWVRVDLRSTEASESEKDLLAAALRGKYRQYGEREDAFARLLVFTVEGASGWSA